MTSKLFALPQDEFVPPRRLRSKRSKDGSFQESIKRLIDHFNKIKTSQINLHAICDKYSFERRRFYDVVNVLEGIGCGRKLDSDRMVWYSLGNVKKHIRKLVQMHILAPPNASIETLLKIDTTLSIVSLTNTYLLTFIALQTKEINIRELAKLLAKYNNRFKSTLCKLYQTTQILRALGIFDSTIQQGQTVISDEIFELMRLNEPILACRPFSIQSLLNCEEPDIKFPSILDQRRRLYSEAIAA